MLLDTGEQYGTTSSATPARIRSVIGSLLKGARSGRPGEEEIPGTMTRRIACPPAPGPLEEYAARFDDLFTHAALRGGKEGSAAEDTAAQEEQGPAAAGVARGAAAGPGLASP